MRAWAEMVVAVGLACAPAAAQAAARCGSEQVYIGTQGAGPGQGVLKTRLELAGGALATPTLAAEAARPTWVQVDPEGGTLFVASDPREPAGEHQVAAYAADRASGALARLDAVSAGGKGPTHLAFDPHSRTLFVANFNSAQVAALPVSADGRLGPPAAVQSTYGTGPLPRQAAPHAHGVTLDPSGRFLLVPDLGADRLFLFRFDPASRALSPAATPFVALPAGSGPRRALFHPNGRLLFLLSELSTEVRVYRWRSASAGLALSQTVSTLRADHQGPRNGASEISVSADGRRLYVASRADDALVVYDVDARRGRLTEVQRLPSGGRTPWSFQLDPTGRWLLVANVGSDSVDLFAVDGRTGRLTPTGSAPAAKPTSIAFLPAGLACR